MEADQLRAMVAAAQKGRSEGYESLLQAYGSRLFSYFFRATGSRHDAEDMLGEMMLKLVGQLKTYVDHGRFDQWLFRVAANMVRDRIRRKRVRPRATSLAEKAEDGQSLEEYLPGPHQPVDGPALAAEDGRQIDAALQRLDETTRQMILLRHFGDMSFKDIADLFDCPLGTALARVHRGLRALRELMEREDEAGN